MKLWPEFRWKNKSFWPFAIQKQKFIGMNMSSSTCLPNRSCESHSKFENTRLLFDMKHELKAARHATNQEFRNVSQPNKKTFHFIYCIIIWNSSHSCHLYSDKSPIPICLLFLFLAWNFAKQSTKTKHIFTQMFHLYSDPECNFNPRVFQQFA